MKKIYLIIFCIAVFLSQLSGKNENSEIKIVSLSPAVTKDLFYLGLEKYLVGVTDYCVFGNKIEQLVKENKVKRVSGYSNFNYELIMSVNPTHILCMDSTSIEQFDMLKKITNSKIITFSHPKNIEEVKNQILELGKIFKVEKKGVLIISEMEKKLIEINKKVSKIDYNKRPKILVEIFYPPFTSCGKNTFISDIVLKAGGRLCFDIDKEWPQLTMEELLNADPDIVVKGHLSETDKSLLILKAYKENHVLFPKNIDDFLQPGIQNIDAIVELNNYIESKFKK